MNLRVVDAGVSAKRIRKSILRILGSVRLCSFATVTSANRAHIHTAYFCFSDDLELFFLSDPGSLHCRNLSVNSSMAAAIFSSAQRWGGPDRGVQLFGTGHPLRGARERKAESLYRARFPAYAKWKALLGQQESGRGYRFYCFRARRLKVLDETEFGDGVFVAASVQRESPARSGPAEDASTGRDRARPVARRSAYGGD